MNLIFIYGPPASGKLTIAEELVKQNGYKLFHNHLTQDLAREIYPEFDEVRLRLVDRLRLDIFEYTAQNNTDIVFTFVYADGGDDDKFIADTVTVVTKNGGEVFFVQLETPDDVLLERVTNDSRKKFHKISDVGTLSEKLKDTRYSTVAHQPVYKLDTSKQNPADSAKLILEHYPNLRI